MLKVIKILEIIHIMQIIFLYILMTYALQDIIFHILMLQIVKMIAITKKAKFV